jgi:uncharacterized protein YlaI
VTYRNPRLLQLAKEAPCCMYCGMDNYGQVVAAHSNQLQHGKGKGLKAHDIPAYVCNVCHDQIDGRTNPGLIDLSRADKERMWYDAMFRTMLWLLENGHLHMGCGCEKGAA